MSNVLRGAEREQSLSREAYFSDGYFALPQLCSLAQQIHEIHALRPRNVLEVGIGNGFTSAFLRRAGYQLKTADINPALEPDICAPLSEVASHLRGERFDLVVCCEVLEHIPFEEFESNIDSLRGLGERLFMTLPNFKAPLGFGGFLRLPKIAPRLLDMFVDVRRPRKLEAEHFWEVGSSAQTTREAILAALSKRYSQVSCKRFPLNPAHIAFYGS